MASGAFWKDHGCGLGMEGVTACNDLAGVPGCCDWDGAFGTSWQVDPTEQLVGVLMTQRRPDVVGIADVVLDFWTAAYQLIDG